MNRKKAVLKIILKSDLCVASGYAFMGSIDSDVCYNENGIPYIPGRRLKGCLRDAGELIGISNIETIFGAGGDNKIRGVWIDNAYPEGFEQLNFELTEVKLTDSPYAKYLTQQKVLEYYTRIVSNTQIEEETGTAKKNSLRYTRVVNQFLPQKEEPMCFFAKIEFDCDKEQLENTVKALRHIGLNRNRGFGNIECQFV